jgi:iron complex outermembrane recepter protein
MLPTVARIRIRHWQHPSPAATNKRIEGRGMGTLHRRSVPRILLRLPLAGAFVLGRTIANAADPTDETQPEQVIVTEGRYAESATRTLEPILDVPRNVQVVPRQLIEDRAIDDPQDAIQNVSAVMRGGSAIGEGEAFAIRGFRQQDIFKDGFRDGEAVGFSLNATGPTDVSNLDRIEVLKGPAAILFGRGEPGGVVNYITRTPYFGNGFSLDQRFGSYDFYRTCLDANWQLVPAKSAVRLDAAYENSDSFRDFVHGERYFFAPAFLWQIDDKSTLTLRTEYGRDVRTTDRGLPYFNGRVLAGVPYDRYLGEPSFTELTNKPFRGLITLDRRWSDWAETVVSVHGRHAESNGAYVAFQNSGGFVSNPATGLISRFVGVLHITDTGTTVRVDQTFSGTLYRGAGATAGEDGIRDRPFPTVKNQLLLSFEYERQTNDSLQVFSALPPINAFNPVYTGYVPLPFIPGFPIEIPQTGGVAAHSSSLLLLDRISIGDRAYLSFGGRPEWFNASQSVSYGPNNIFPPTNASPDQFTFNPTAGLVIKPRQLLSLYLSYARSTNSFQNLTARTQSGEIVAPERSRAYEAGAKTELLKSRLLLTTAVFQIEKTNVVGTDPNNPFFSTNSGEQRSRGLEFDLAGQPIPGWRINLDYAYVDARIIDAPKNLNVGHRLYGVPFNSAGSFTTYEFRGGAFKGLGLGGGIFFAGQVQNTNTNNGQLPGWAQTDLVAYYKLGRYKAQLNVKNLFDRQFYYSMDLPSSVQPATARTIIGTLSVKF